ncbi:MAG: hypothetical protein R3B13_27150 [Polyangiaceae bacterium]
MQTAWVVHVVALLTCAGCGGATSSDYNGTEREAGTDAAVAPDATGDAGPLSDSAVDSGSDSANSCALVGKGPGVETCCEGKLCHGECTSGWYPCKCAGSVCPATAACCVIELSPGNVQGPYCVAPEDCVVPQ